MEKRPKGDFVRVAGRPVKGAKVAKDNVLIEGSYWLTWLENTLMWWVVWVYQQERSQHLTISVHDFCHWACINNSKAKYYETLKAARRLRAREFLIEKNDGKTGACGFLRYVEWGEDHSGELDIVITDEILPYIEKFIEDPVHGFTRLNLDRIVSLRTFYSQRLYEYARSKYFGVGKTKGWSIRFDELRLKLGCLRIDSKGRILQDRYSKWKLFKYHVLDKAIKEILEKCGTNLKYETLRCGRKIEWIHFKAETQQQKGPTEFNDANENDFANRMRFYGVLERDIKSTIKKYAESDPERITLAITEVKRQMATKNKVRNPAGLLLKLIDVNLKEQQIEKQIRELDKLDWKRDLQKRR